jgi:integrase
MLRRLVFDGGEWQMASVRKRTWRRGDETKTAWIADYFDQDGKRHIKTFALKRDAVDWLGETKIEVKQGVHTPESKSVTVAEAGEEWIAQAATDGLERSTIRQYQQHLKHHIEPFIGTVKLAELTPSAVQNYRNRLVRDGRSHVMAKKALGSLGAILANAMANARVARNVVRDQARQHERRRQRRLEKRHKKQIEVGVDIPTKDEIRALLTHAQGRGRPLIVTAIFTGLRASELRGLTWDDVDFDRETMTVRQRADRWNAIGSPKSDAGRREVPLAPMVVNALKEWNLACPKGEAGLVFPNGSGNVESLPNIHRSILGPLQFAAGITMEKRRPKYGMHAFRHAAASLFIEQGFSPKRVQALMGHSTIQMTFDTYGHLFPGEDGDKVAMRQLQARLVAT